MKSIVRAMLMRDAAAVKRYHTQRTIRQQPVGEHSFGMLLLIDQVYPECRKEVWRAIMHHDLPELMTGDMPGPMKRASPQLGVLMEELEQDLAPLYQDIDLSTHEVAVIKWCDKVELVLWCLEEAKMGNLYALDPVVTALGWMAEAKHPNKACEELMFELVAYVNTFPIERKTHVS